MVNDNKKKDLDQNLGSSGQNVTLNKLLDVLQFNIPASLHLLNLINLLLPKITAEIQMKVIAYKASTDNTSQKLFKKMTSNVSIFYSVEML